MINPLGLKSDQHLISPYNITPKSHSNVTRIKEMITSKRVLFVGILGNTKRTMWRIQRLMQVVKGVKTECTFSTRMLKTLITHLKLIFTTGGFY